LLVDNPLSSELMHLGRLFREIRLSSRTKGKAMVRQNPQASESTTFDDGVLKRMYVEYDTPCDSLVSDPASLQSFTEDYVGRTGQQVESAQVSHRLLTLRKLGEAKGGLPKLRRKYNGRN